MNFGIPFLLMILIFTLIAFAVREIILWYWKVNERIKNQQKIIHLLIKLLYQNGGELSDTEKDFLGYK